MIRKTIHVQVSDDGYGNTKEINRYITKEEVPDETEKEIQARLRTEEIKQTPEYQLLDTMIEELSDAGVDVSYFPGEAWDVLLEYSKKITIK